MLAGETLYAGGGARDDSTGFVQVVDARTGRLLREHTLPARVTECGLAAAYGRLYVSLENGEVVCLESR
jgi:outer membrane protein assembly factor BamB